MDYIWQWLFGRYRRRIVRNEGLPNTKQEFLGPELRTRSVPLFAIGLLYRWGKTASLRMLLHSRFALRLLGLVWLIVTVFRDTESKDLTVWHYTSNLLDTNPSLDPSTSSWWGRQVDWVCGEEAIERRLFYEYAVQELPNRVNEIHKWGSWQYGLSRESNTLWSLNFDGVQTSDVYEQLYCR